MNSPYELQYAKWVSYHLSEQDIKSAISFWFSIRGQKVDTTTLRLYGYESEPTTELIHFQGHVSVLEHPTFGYAFGNSVIQ